MARRRWSEMSPGQRAAVAGAAAVQIGLAVTAWVDLARRPAPQVRGPKPVWAVVIAVNFVGPVAYFIAGRCAPPPGPTAPSADRAAIVG